LANLYISLILRPKLAPVHAPQITLMAAVALAETVASFIPQPAAIKWPNDILVDGKKLAGILTEACCGPDSVHYVILGIGVNLNSTLAHFPSELHAKATSLYLAGGRRVERARFAARLLAQLEERYERFLAAGFAALAQEWNARSALTGRSVRITGVASESVWGTCTGIDTDGALLLERDGVSQRMLAGDVTIVGGYE